MTLTCDCGEITTITKDVDSHYSDGEGWYAISEGSIRFWSAHDIVGFVCDKCGNELWKFV